MSKQEYLSIGANLKRIRINKGITQKELAEKVGLVYSSYSNYENGNRIPSKKTLEKIAEVLNVDIFELMYDELTAKKIHEQANKEFNRQCDILDDRRQYLLNIFNMLNDEGQKKAIERVEELTEIKRYTTDYIQKTEDDSDLIVEFKKSDKSERLLTYKNILNAAHERTDIEVTEEMKKHDDNIMDDENF